MLIKLYSKRCWYLLLKLLLIEVPAFFFIALKTKITHFRTDRFIV